MPEKETFDILLLIARPAAGKSEIINHLKNIDPITRIRRFHVGEFEEIDDFPMLWTWLEEDNLLTKMGQKRLHSNEKGLFIEHYLWDLLIERICLDYSKNIRENPEYHLSSTTIIEFSRGAEHGGYKRAFAHLSEEILYKLAILYVNVSWGESFRKNQIRFNPERPDSILEHSLPNEKLKILYKEDDWSTISTYDPQFINIKGFQVPYVVFENEDDVTTQQGEALSLRLETSLQRLWDLYRLKDKMD
jgi:hypothetical protein